MRGTVYMDQHDIEAAITTYVRTQAGREITVESISFHYEAPRASSGSYGYSDAPARYTCTVEIASEASKE